MRRVYKVQNFVDKVDYFGVGVCNRSQDEEDNELS